MVGMKKCGMAGDSRRASLVLPDSSFPHGEEAIRQLQNCQKPLWRFILPDASSCNRGSTPCVIRFRKSWVQVLSFWRPHAATTGPVRSSPVSTAPTHCGQSQSGRIADPRCDRECRLHPDPRGRSGWGPASGGGLFRIGQRGTERSSGALRAGHPVLRLRQSADLRCSRESRVQVEFRRRLPRQPPRS